MKNPRREEKKRWEKERKKKQLTREEEKERKREKEYLILGSADWFYFIKNYIETDEHIQMEGNIIKTLEGKAIVERASLVDYRKRGEISDDRKLVKEIYEYVDEIRNSIHLLKLLLNILMPMYESEQLKKRNGILILRDFGDKSYGRVREFLLETYKYVGQGKAPWFARMRKIRKEAEDKVVFLNGEIHGKNFVVNALNKDIEKNEKEIKKYKYYKEYVDELRNEIKEYERRKSDVKKQILEYKKKREKHVSTTKRVSRRYKLVYKTYFPGFELYVEMRKLLKRALERYTDGFQGMLFFAHSRRRERMEDFKRDIKRQKTKMMIKSNINKKNERIVLEYHYNHPKVLTMLEDEGDDRTEKEIVMILLIEETNADDYESTFYDKMVNTLTSIGFDITKDVLLKMLKDEEVDWYDVASLFIKLKKVDPVKDKVRASDLIFKPVIL